MKTEPLTTISEAAAELGLPRTTFRNRLIEKGLFPSRRVPHSPTGKGFTPSEMERLRAVFADERPMAVSA